MKIINYSVLGFLFLMSFLIFYRIIHLDTYTDLSLHIEQIVKINKGEVILPSHFLFFGLVSISTLLSSNIGIVSIATCVFLSLSIVAKFIVTNNILKDQLAFKEKKFQYIPLIVSFLLIFVINMPSKPMWINVQPPISWHNSTTIFVFPFVLLMFYYSYKMLVSDFFDRNRLLIMTLLGCVIMLIKPNYILVFFVAYPLMNFYLYGLRKRFIISAIPLFVFAIVLLLQFYYTYTYAAISEKNEMYRNVKIFVEPFHAWKKISSNITLSFVSWVLYPLFFCFFYLRKIYRNNLWIYTVINFFAAFAIFILFTEKEADGKNIGAVNFLWQAILCSYILFLVSVMLNVKIVQEKGKLDKKDWFLVLVFLYHPIAGLIYILRTVFELF